MSFTVNPIKESLPLGNPYLGRTTPLHVAQLVLLLLKEVFAEVEEGHPFKYTDNFETTKIAFDTIFNKDSDVYGKKPTIIVSRGSVSTNPVVLGDLAAANGQLIKSIRTSLIQSSTEIKVISKKSMNADILAQDIFIILMSTRTMFPAITNVHSVTSVNASPVTKFEENDTLYYSTISMNFLMQYQWLWQIDTEVLNSISLKFNEETDSYRQLVVTT